MYFIALGRFELLFQITEYIILYNPAVRFGATKTRDYKDIRQSMQGNWVTNVSHIKPYS